MASESNDVKLGHEVLAVLENKQVDTLLETLQEQRDYIAQMEQELKEHRKNAKWCRRMVSYLRGVVPNIMLHLPENTALCMNCNDPARGRKSGKCTGCRVVWYCSPGCQAEHWREHKSVCPRLIEQID